MTQESIDAALLARIQKLESDIAGLKHREEIILQTLEEYIAKGLEYADKDLITTKETLK